MRSSVSALGNDHGSLIKRNTELWKNFGRRYEASHTLVRASPKIDTNELMFALLDVLSDPVTRVKLH